MGQAVEIEARGEMELQQGHRAAGAVGDEEATTKCGPQETKLEASFLRQAL